MILNISQATAAVMLDVVDTTAQHCLRTAKSKDPTVRHNSVVLLQHMGILKHRLEYGLGVSPAFIGPAAWGYPLHGKPPKSMK